jgi:Mn-containing catalase
MSELKQLLVQEMQYLLDAEDQLTSALPKMASAAHNPKLKEGFQKHLKQTENHVNRLQEAFNILGEKAQAKTCRAMQGLVAAGEEVIQQGKNMQPVTSDIALAAAAQKVEHYEISSYGSARSLARLMGAKEVAHLLQHTLGEEEATDYLLTEFSKPLLQQAASELYSTTKLGTQTATATR